jgi:hypothetical protein
MIIYASIGSPKLAPLAYIGLVALYNIVNPHFTKRIRVIVAEAVFYLSLFSSEHSVLLINKVMNSIYRYLPVGDILGFPSGTRIF